MDSIKDNGQKLLVVVVVLLLILVVLIVLISNQNKVSYVSALSDVLKAIETFNFSSSFGVLLLFLSLFIGVFAVYFLEFLVAVLRNEFGGVIYMAQTLRLKNHYIVCGGGRIGERIAFLLREQHKLTIILESEEARAVELKKLGFKVLRESALDEKSFKLANAKKAVAVFACLGQDVDNFLVVLNARESNKNAKIFTRCNSIKNIKKFIQLGANEVILPEIVGADRMVYLSQRERKK